MPITPRGTSFMVSVGSAKDRQRVTVATMPLALAKEAEMLQERQGLRLKQLTAAAVGDSSKTLQDAFDRVYKDTWKGSKGERTTVLNAKAMLVLLGPNTPITEINSDALTEAIDELDDLGNSGATINRKLSVVMVMLKEARERGWLKFLPYAKRRKEIGRRVFHYTEADEREMVAACNHLGLTELGHFIQFAIDTGFRRSELLRLRLADCADNVFHLHAGETKNDDGRAIPATAPAWAIAQAARDKGSLRVFQGLTEATLRNQWEHMRDYLGKAEDPKYIVHVLRHTTATRLALKGATGPQIMAFMGHKSIQTSMIYIHLAHGHLVGVAELLTRTPPSKEVVAEKCHMAHV